MITGATRRRRRDRRSGAALAVAACCTTPRTAALGLDWVFVAFEVPDGGARGRARRGPRARSRRPVGDDAAQDRGGRAVRRALAGRGRAAQRQHGHARRRRPARRRLDRRRRASCGRCADAGVDDPAGRVGARARRGRRGPRGRARARPAPARSVVVCARKPDAAAVAARARGRRRRSPWDDRARGRGRGRHRRERDPGRDGAATRRCRSRRDALHAGPGASSTSCTTRSRRRCSRRPATGARGVVDGLGMLVHQAALQVERWTGRPAPVDGDARGRRAALRPAPDGLQRVGPTFAARAQGAALAVDGRRGLRVVRGISVLQGTFETLSLPEVLGLLAQSRKTRRALARRRPARRRSSTSSTATAARPRRATRASRSTTAPALLARLVDVCFAVERARTTARSGSGPRSRPWACDETGRARATRSSRSTACSSSGARSWRVIPSLECRSASPTSSASRSSSVDRERWPLLVAIDGRRTVRELVRKTNRPVIDVCHAHARAGRRRRGRRDGPAAGRAPAAGPRPNGAAPSGVARGRGRARGAVRRPASSRRRPRSRTRPAAERRPSREVDPGRARAATSAPFSGRTPPSRPTADDRARR